MTTAPQFLLKKDPVCGMTVDPATAKGKVEHRGETYYFCCNGCMQKFQATPEEYLKPKRPALVTLGGVKPATTITPASPVPELEKSKYVCPMCPEISQSRPGPCPKCGMALERETPASMTKTEYTCPMHPEIVRAEPGSCPICGMALEPRTVTAIEEDNPELRDMTRRFWISVALTVPLLGITMAHMLPGMPIQRALANGSLLWIELLLATPVVFWGGWP
ncbi:MAG: YHS domain-containing protein, partial [Acidobacteriales bacterium]|nr:YHS domain-containing protein [Terriglobales bacterium]